MTRADIMVLVTAIVLLPFLYIHLWAADSPGQQVRIISGSNKPIVMSLAQAKTITVHGMLGDSIIEIKQGKARFKYSPCRNKVCIHSGWLHTGGEFTACLPNRVSLQVIGKDNRYDAINF